MSNPNGNQRGTQGRPSAALITAKQDNPIEALRLTMVEAGPRLAAIVGKAMAMAGMGQPQKDAAGRQHTPEDAAERTDA